MSYFNYETALNNKGIDKNDLPKEVQDQIKTLIATARKFDQSEDGSDEQIELNKELDRLDDQIVSMINAHETTDPGKQDPGKQEPGQADPKPQETKSGSNTGVQILIGAGIIAGLFWVGKKFLGK
jgi:hypothetical protein